MLMPELQYNVRLNVDKVATGIHKFGSDLKREWEKVMNLPLNNGKSPEEVSRQNL